MDTVPQSKFQDAYLRGSAPWVIGEPQPAIVELERAGLIGGSVLDVGCGAGEHTIHLARLGYDVLGVDFAPAAVEQARENALRHGVSARFAVADALRLDGLGGFDTVVDSALFHVFDAGDQVRYVRSLYAATRPGAVVHVLALSDVEPGFGPRISEAAIRAAFRDPGWVLEHVVPSRYRAIPSDEDRANLGLPATGPADLLAWLARARRC
ncbi:MAG TPA: class I SAM-dependent methyltransferase [Pseudonocardia sp.]|jgi:SAM-dependent methyltransferase|uniref:class I SAM-dependent methyltransferase n=1 Tax=Pseudonocardia sp. TaxID=60912 RepID=UPI002ED78D55